MKSKSFTYILTFITNSLSRKKVLNLTNYKCKISYIKILVIFLLFNHSKTNYNFLNF